MLYYNNISCTTSFVYRANNWDFATVPRTVCARLTIIQMDAVVYGRVFTTSPGFVIMCLHDAERMRLCMLDIYHDIYDTATVCSGKTKSQLEVIMGTASNRKYSSVV